MDIRIGAPVLADDVQVGQVDRVILNPETRQVEGIIVVQGWLLSHDVAIPSELILSADGDGVRVRATAEQIDALETVTLSQYTTPPEDWIPPDNTAASQFLFPASPYAVGAFTMPAPQLAPTEDEVVDVEAGDVTLNDGTPVFCTDGEVGAVSRVITQADSDQATLLVIDCGRASQRLVAVPMDRVTSISEDRVNLALSERELDGFPEWQASTGS